jgi:hypothetical protein
MNRLKYLDLLQLVLATPAGIEPPTFSLEGCCSALPKGNETSRKTADCAAQVRAWPIAAGTLDCVTTAAISGTPDVLANVAATAARDPLRPPTVHRSRQANVDFLPGRRTRSPESEDQACSQGVSSFSRKRRPAGHLPKLMDPLSGEAISAMPELANGTPFAFVVDSLLVRATDYSVGHRDR